MTTPLQQQIYERLRRQMAEGSLAPGQRVPSSRALASELGVARGTVQAAYDRLAGEGWLLGRGAAGTWVTTGVARAARPTATRLHTIATASTTASAEAPTATTAPRPAEPLPLRLGLPALDAFPRALWARLLAREARSGSLALDRPDPAGHTPLRAAIAAHLGRSRGVHCTPEQVLVVPAYGAALQLVADALLARGDAAWVETPGFPPTTQALLRAGARPVPVPVDGQGLVVAEGLRRAPRARLAVVTPSHHSPLGMALSLPRRLALLDWAQQAQAFIVEDDYDGEYRYDGHPLPALHSLDVGARVVYLGTFSKTLFPGLRLAWVVAPAARQADFEAAAARSPQGGCPVLPQAVTATFLQQGHFARHVRKMRALYARRRAWLVEALALLQPDGLTVQPGPSGMHLVLASSRAEADTELARRAQVAGLAVQALSAWRNGDEGPAGLLAGFTNVTSAAQAQALARRLRQALRAG